MKNILYFLSVAAVCSYSTAATAQQVERDVCIESVTEACDLQWEALQYASAESCVDDMIRPICMEGGRPPHTFIFGSGGCFGGCTAPSPRIVGR